MTETCFLGSCERKRRVKIELRAYNFGTSVSSSSKVAAVVAVVMAGTLLFLHVGGCFSNGIEWNPFDFLLNHSSRDTDGDGYPDGVDAFPRNPLEWVDSDSDGIGDNADNFPYDRDNDGFNDTVDLVPDADAGINLTIESISIWDAVDYLSDTTAEVYILLVIDGVNMGMLNSSGAVWNCPVGSTTLINETFTFDLDDDVRNHTIELTMMDADVMGDGDILDIDGTSPAGRTLIVVYDIVAGTWTGNDVDGLANGSADGTSTTDDNDAALRFDITPYVFDEVRLFEWTFDGKEYSLQLTIPSSSYAECLSNGVERQTHYDYADAKAFVTSDDPIILDLLSKLEDMAEDEQFSDRKTVDFVLSFCQGIEYSLDDDTVGVIEYWRFPVETLYDQTGDCEDTSLLFASLIEAMGYDAVMIMPPEHMAVGVAWSTIPGGASIQYGGKSYYYCETTGVNMVMGYWPPEIEDKNCTIVQVE